MHLLAIETSGARGGIAIAEGPVLVEEIILSEGLRHARDLAPAIRDAFRRAGWTPRSADIVAVSIGPGSFTGIRIAVTVAKFIAWDTGAKVVAVPTLLALALNAPADARHVAAILDAKRGGLFAGIFERRPSADRALKALLLDEFAQTFGPALIEPEDLAPKVPRPAVVIGHGIPKARQALGGLDFAVEPLWDVRPSVVARLGWELHERGRLADPLRLEPVYIRPPEAQEIWQRRHQCGG